MNASITIIAVRNQLAGMGCDRFDIGVLRPNARMLLREGWSPDQIIAAINCSDVRMLVARTYSCVRMENTSSLCSTI
ncbi:MAG: hypothetical protein ACYDC3_20810 [Candidatus Binataceae bacterium]